MYTWEFIGLILLGQNRQPTAIYILVVISICGRLKYPHWNGVVTVITLQGYFIWLVVSLDQREFDYTRVTFCRQ